MRSPAIMMVAQRHESDCVVACLAMFAGVSYELALVACPKTVLTEGMSFAELQTAARRLGFKLTERRRVRLTEDTGIVWVAMKAKADHAVVLRGGLIFDTNLCIWEAADYFAQQKAKPARLLTVVG